MDFEGVEVVGEWDVLISELDAECGKIDSFHDVSHDCVRFFGVRTCISVLIHRKS